ncbi:hypothetical protein DFH06DRAFT_1303699 [Mycena polygramma]|nr:hypothetical protein DFH06DRAFT_1303699 [Mycena polygramma]
MPLIDVLFPELLSEIMLRMPLDIDQKFVFAQVSRLWRDIALQNPVFWSSFTGGASKLDYYRLPLVLERTGSSVLLHVGFHLTDKLPVKLLARRDALKALVPYVSRIETLDITFAGVTEWLNETLLNSRLEFPALRTLRFEGPEYAGTGLPLSLAAPWLRVLDLEHVRVHNWSSLLSPDLETIRLFRPGDANVDVLWSIFSRCPKASCVVMHRSPWLENHTDAELEGFARLPPTPALRELELSVDLDLGRVLKAGFSDVVLHLVTGFLRYPIMMEELAAALLPGIGPLDVIDVHEQQIELRDVDGHIRRLKCLQAGGSFDVEEVWRHLSEHYGLHKTVREIRIPWNSLQTLFEFYFRVEYYPPRRTEGIKLSLEATLDIPSPPPHADNAVQTPRGQIPGLAKVEFRSSRDYLLLRIILKVLAQIEPPRGRKVEVCVGQKRLTMEDLEQNASDTFQTVLLKDGWAICSHCF